jgi:hypothetical protein
MTSFTFKDASSRNRPWAAFGRLAPGCIVALPARQPVAPALIEIPGKPDQQRNEVQYDDKEKLIQSAER